MRRSTQCNPFNDVYLLSKYDVSGFSMTGDIEISNWSFFWLWAFQSWYWFCLLWASQNCPCLFYLDRSQLLYSVWVRHTVKNNPNALGLIKIQEPQSMIQSAGIKNWFPQSINRLYMFNLLFLSVTRFFWFLPWNKMYMIKIKTGKVLQNWGNIF